MTNGHENNVTHRLKIVEGHIKKINRMHQDGAYCIDLLHQLQAVKAALSKIESKLMENHLKTCVQNAFKNGKQKQAIGEILTIFDKTR